MRSSLCVIASNSAAARWPKARMSPIVGPYLRLSVWISASRSSTSCSRSGLNSMPSRYSRSECARSDSSSDASSTVLPCSCRVGSRRPSSSSAWLDLSQQINDRPLLVAALVERQIGFLGERRQLLGVAQQRALAQQLLFVAVVQIGGADLVGLVAQQIDAAGDLALVGHQALQLAAHAAQGGDAVGDLRPRRGQTGVAVKEVDVLADAQQREMLALAVDVNQELCDVLQHARRHGAPVDARCAASRPVNLPAQDQRALFRRQPVLAQAAGQLGRIGQGEDALDACAVCAGAHEFGAILAAQQRVNGVDDDGLAGAGFARQHAEIGRQCQVQPVDDGKVGDCQFG